MLKLYLGKAHVICWIVIGSFVQTGGFSTTIVKEGEDAIIECGVQTKVAGGYLRWATMNNGSPVDLAYDLRDGQSSCNDRIINCTLYANGSIQLESVSKEDAARYYRCLRGDEDGYNYFSDHRLLVLSKESPLISQSPTSAIAVKASRKGIVHSYGEPVCEDDVDENLPVVCYPPSGVIVDREYETIQCNCTDSDGLMDSVTFPVTRQMSSPPSIETPHRESVSSYNIGKKGVLHGYNAPVCEDDVDWNLPVDCYPPSGIIVDRKYETIQCNCTDSDGLMDNVTFPVSRQMSSPPSIETPHNKSNISYNMDKKGVLYGYNAPVCEDDVDGNLPVVCYPPSGVIVDREYETIQCNCTDSDGLMDNVTFPVTSLTHWVHPGWKKATISLLVISILIILVLILICCYLYMKCKKSKAYHPENLAVLKGSKRRKEDDKMAADPEELNLIESGTKDKQISDLKDKIAALEGTLNNSNTELQEREREVSHLTEQKKTQETEMKNKLEEQNQKINTIQTEITERKKEVSHLKDQLEQKQRQETEMKNKLEEQNEQISKTEKELAVKEAENNGLEERLKDKQQQISSLEKILYNPAFFQQQRETASKQDGKKYQEDDNNSEFDKNSSPSEKETKEEGTPRKGKKKDPERQLTQMGYPIMPPLETPGKNNQNDQDVETDIDDSHTTEENKNLDKDETDFSKSKRCSNASSNASGTKLRAFKDYFIEEVSKCKGFNLGFKCDGTDMRIELRINDDDDGVICHYEFRNGWIIPSFRGKPEKAIGVTNETSYELNLGDDMRALSLCQGKSAQRNKCLNKFEKYDFLQLRLLCIYTSDTSSVSILSHLGLIEL